MDHSLRALLSNILLDRRSGNLFGFLFCVCLMAYALYSQHVLGFEPCPLCIFQRVAVMATGGFFLLAAIHNPKIKLARLYGLLGLIAALCGVGIAARHIWIQAQPPGTVAACGTTLDYMLDILPVTDVITKVLTGSGECADTRTDVRVTIHPAVPAAQPAEAPPATSSGRAPPAGSRAPRRSRAGAARCRRRRTPPPCRSAGRPCGRGAGPR